ncbi:phosphoadenylyl-sulfate reductase [Saccharicrinis sp. FJH54]|uniref:phosphoadenylyl-sulfate reductase n=1 Tax=Saccharicrinis sp. FJH54 TaxID=3344665 RepID=UPI0035D3F4AC
MLKDKVEYYNDLLKDKTPQDVLSFFYNEFNDKIALSSSLGAEDQVLTDMIAKHARGMRIFTLDTGRLFPETYSLISRTNDKYGIKIHIMFPDYKSVEKMVKDKGINLFYESVENRKLCCHIRKIEPLKRAFKDLDVWVCGLRASQSVTRQNVHIVEWDEPNALIKINPLANWSEDDVWDYIKKNGVPYNALHNKGFPSIGCQPCTRAIADGEDIRAGRWWWENPETKECGLHKR